MLCVNYGIHSTQISQLYEIGIDHTLAYTPSHIFYTRIR